MARAAAFVGDQEQPARHCTFQEVQTQDIGRQVSVLEADAQTHRAAHPAPFVGPDQEQHRLPPAGRRPQVATLFGRGARLEQDVTLHPRGILAQHHARAGTLAQELCDVAHDATVRLVGQEPRHHHRDPAQGDCRADPRKRSEQHAAAQAHGRCQQRGGAGDRHQRHELAAARGDPARVQPREQQRRQRKGQRQQGQDHTCDAPFEGAPGRTREPATDHQAEGGPERQQVVVDLSAGQAERDQHRPDPEQQQAWTLFLARAPCRQRQQERPRRAHHDVGAEVEERVAARVVRGRGEALQVFAQEEMGERRSAQAQVDECPPAESGHREEQRGQGEARGLEGPGFAAPQPREEQQANAGQQERDRALGEKTQAQNEAEGRSDPGPPASPGSLAQTHRQRREQRDQHVRHGHAPETHEGDAGGQDDDAGKGRAPVEEADAQPRGGQQQAQGGEAGDYSARRSRGPQDLHRPCHQPVRERRLVEERFAAVVGRQPVAALDHGARPVEEVDLGALQARAA